MQALKLTQIGNSIGVILPRELLGEAGGDQGRHPLRHRSQWQPGNCRTPNSSPGSGCTRPLKVNEESLLARQ